MKAFDERYLRLAIDEAEVAGACGEVPIGCIIVRDSEIIARAYNTTERDNDPTAHAEMLAIKQACSKIGNWRLENSVIYVTLEPCPMCMGAILNARINRLVFGAYDERYGAAVSRINMPEALPELGRIQVIGGILKQDCKRLLDEFFERRR